ncbi:MAG: zinc ribbon domain-containing protein [Acidimicrobiales bacterium]
MTQRHENNLVSCLAGGDDLGRIDLSRLRSSFLVAMAAEIGLRALTRHRAKNGRSEYLYYRCPTGLPKHLVDLPACTWPARADELDELVWNEVARHLRHLELILAACSIPLDDNVITHT